MLKFACNVLFANLFTDIVFLKICVRTHTSRVCIVGLNKPNFFSPWANIINIQKLGLRLRLKKPLSARIEAYSHF